MKRVNGWECILQSAECREVSAAVDARRESGERVYPIQEYVFRAFDDCPFEKVRVVILGQDPYAKGQAIGRAFAVSESTKKNPRSLKNIFEALRRNYPSQPEPERTLESWARQGVFLLNTTLTVAHGFSNSHADLGWKEAVTIPTLEKLSAEGKNLVFMLWGAHAKKFDRHLDDERHLILTAPHPSSRREVRDFLECGHFGKANKYLSEKGNAKIVW